jgi:hypothetical protein
LLSILPPEPIEKDVNVRCDVFGGEYARIGRVVQHLDSASPEPHELADPALRI